MFPPGTSPDPFKLIILNILGPLWVYWAFGDMLIKYPCVKFLLWETAYNKEITTFGSHVDGHVCESVSYYKMIFFDLGPQPISRADFWFFVAAM